MAYRFKVSEPIEDGVRRIADEQFVRAAKELKNADTSVAIHETRKCLKRLRALLKLIRPALKPSDYSCANVELRNIARDLSAKRDADVMRATIGKLAKSADGGQARVLTKLEKDLSTSATPAAQASVHDDESRELLRKSAKSLKQARRTLRELELRETGFDVVIAGFENAYARGRKQYWALRQGADDSLSHEWRKSVQAHWRQQVLLSAAWPEYLAVRVETARVISEALGDEHDLEVLEQFAGRQLDKGQVAEISELIASRKRELRQDAYREAARLYADNPRRLAKRMAGYWQAASEEAEKGAARAPTAGAEKHANTGGAEKKRPAKRSDKSAGRYAGEARKSAAKRPQRQTTAG